MCWKYKLKWRITSLSFWQYKNGLVNWKSKIKYYYCRINWCNARRLSTVNEDFLVSEYHPFEKGKFFIYLFFSFNKICMKILKVNIYVKCITRFFVTLVLGNMQIIIIVLYGIHTIFTNRTVKKLWKIF